MPDRSMSRAAFLQKTGWQDADVSALASDASFRTYDRLVLGNDRAVLMDAPPPKEDVQAFADLARHLSKIGITAPEILGEDRVNGYLLLEDLGDGTFTRLLNEGADAAELYATAVDLLIHLHGMAPEKAVPRALPRYDERRLMDEALLLADWYAPAVLDRELEETEREDYIERWHPIIDFIKTQPPTLVLRDFHVDNLMMLPNRQGIDACAVLDFQDAVSGPAAYDLMSLLEDARRDLDEGLVGQMLGRYVAAFPDLDLPQFEQAFAATGAQRHAKIIGIFTRLCHRDGKAQYLHHIPRVWQLLERSLHHPSLADVQAWFDKTLPPSFRVIPPETRPEEAA